MKPRVLLQVTSAKKNILAFLFLFLACLAAPSARSATYYWDTNDATAGFGTAGGTWAAPTTNNSTQGWSTSAAGTSTLSGETTTNTSDALNFGTGSAGLASGTITVSGNVSSAGITFGNASGNITLSGGSITLNGGLSRIGSATTTQTINSDIVLVGARQFGANQVNEKLVFGGNISGSGASLTLDTNATGGFITLNGTNSFSGNLSIVRGQLNINSVSDKLVDSALGAGSKIIAGAAGGQGLVLNYTANSNGSTNRDLELNVMGGGSLTITSQNAALTLSGTAFSTVANGNGILRLSGDGGGGANINQFSGLIQDNGTSSMSVELLNVTPTGGSAENGFWKLSGNNTYSGTTTVTNTSTLIVGHSNALGTTANGTSLAANGQLLLADGVSVGAEALVLNSTAGSSWNGQTGAALRSYTGNNSWAGNITISQATSIATNLGSNFTISGGITATNQNLTINSIGNTGISGNITIGTGTLTKNGTGTLALSGSNTYSGITTVNGGTLQLAKTASLYNANSANWTAANINVKSGAALALNVDSAGTAGFNSTDLNTLLTNISVANSAAQGLLSGAVLALDTSTATGASFTQGNVIANSTGASGGGIALVKLGAGTLVLDKANTYTGSTTISAGTLTVSGGSAIADTSAVSVGGGAVLNLGASETIGSIAGAGNITLGSFTLTAGGDNSSTSVSGHVTGTGGFTKAGSGTLTLSGNNTYSGNTTVNAGTLKAGSTTALATTGAFSVAAGATLDLGGFNNTISGLSTATGTITDSSSAGSGGTLKIGTAMPGTASAQLFTGSLGLQFYGGGTVNSVLSNTANTYSGGTILGLGTGSTVTRILTASNIGAGTGGNVTSGIFGTGTITIGASTTDNSQLYLFNGVTINNNIVVNTSRGNSGLELGAFRFDGNGTVAGSINANLADATFNSYGTGNVSITGAITGNSGLTVMSASTHRNNVTLNNAGTANSYAGNTTINTANATLTLGRADQISNGAGKGNLIINSGTFNMGGYSETINGLSGNGTIDGLSGTPTLTVGDNDATSTFTGVIRNTAGSLALTKIGTGTITISGNNTYGGATTVSAGTLEIGAAGRLGGGSYSGNIANSGTFLYSGTNAQTLSGEISGVGSLTKNGSSLLTLSGANSYNGTTTLNAGTLRIGNSAALGTSTLVMNSASAVIDSAAGTSYTLSNNITLATNGKIGATSAIGNLTFSGVVSGAGNLVVDTLNGVTTLTGLNTFTGNVIVDRAAVDNGLSFNSIADAGVASALGAGSSISVGIGASAPFLTYTGNTAASSNRTISLVGGEAYITSNSAALTLTGNITTSATQTLRLRGTAGGGANFNELSGVYSGGGSLSVQTATGSDVWKISGNNTFTGTTSVISNAALIVGHSNAFGSTANGTQVSTNAQILLTGNISVGAEALSLNTSAGGLWNGQTGAALRSYTGNNSWAGSITIGQATTIATNSGAGLTLSGNISGSHNLTFNSIGDTTVSGNISTGTGNFTKTGTGTLTLSGNNTFTGTTTVNAGVLRANATGALGSTTNILVTGGSLLVGANDAINNSAAMNLAGGTLAFSGNINETIGALTLSANSTIDMGGGNIALEFSNMVAGLTNTTRLNIYNYTLYSDHIYFTSNTNLSSSLQYISFYSDFGTTFIGNSFISSVTPPWQVQPVPEPETWATATILLAGAGFAWARKRRISSSPEKPLA